MIKLLTMLLGRRRIFDLIFSSDEKIAIINALWRRSDDDSDLIVTGHLKDANAQIKYECEKIAFELSK